MIDTQINLQEWLDAKTDLTLKTLDPLLKDEDKEPMLSLVAVLNEVLIQQLFNRGYIQIPDDAS